MALADKVVVVTGAGRGMGQAIVRGFLGAGSRVVALDLDWGDIADWKASLEADPNVLVVSADVTSDSDLAAAFQATLRRFGTVDVIVNNAGYRQRNVVPTTRINVLDIPPEQWQRMIDVNTTGPWNVIRHFSPPMLERRSGSIVSTGSTSGLHGRPGNQPYGQSKAALLNWLESLAEELKPYNIACNAFLPGETVTTGFAEQRQAQLEAGFLPSSTTPRSKPLKAESCVPLVLFLADQDARVTGYLVEQVLDWNKLHGLGGEEVWAADV